MWPLLLLYCLFCAVSLHQNREIGSFHLLLCRGAIDNKPLLHLTAQTSQHSDRLKSFLVWWQSHEVCHSLFAIKGNITRRPSDSYNFCETRSRRQTIAMGTAEEINNGFLMTFTPKSKAVFSQNLMLLKAKLADSSVQGSVFSGGLVVSILKAFDQSSSTFCSCRAISHALHGSADQAVSALACGWWAYNPSGNSTASITSTQGQRGKRFRRLETWSENIKHGKPPPVLSLTLFPPARTRFFLELFSLKPSAWP